MAKDMKETIAEAVKRLLLEKNVRKLTVKDIVEECRITRQAFYYHFEDIPDLLRWIMERGSRKMAQELQQQNGAKEGIRYFFLMAINVIPHVKRGLQTAYAEEIERYLLVYIRRLFETVVEEQNLYQNSSRAQLDLILRYHSHAVMGILQEWTEQDTGNVDEIADQIYRLMTGETTPFS